MSFDHQYLDESQFLDCDQENDTSIVNEVKDSSENYKSADDLLIDLVRSYPHLWDKSNKDFKDSTKKDTSWEEIAAVLNKSAESCKKRWERLRQYYSKERQKQDFETRSGRPRVQRKKWKLYDAMTFLNQHMRRRNTFSNFSLNNIINLEQSTTDEEEKDEGSIVFDCDELTEAEKTPEWDTNKTTFGDKTNDSSLSEANTFSSTSEQSCISTIQDVSQSILSKDLIQPSPMPSPKLIRPSPLPSPKLIRPSPSPSPKLIRPSPSPSPKLIRSSPSPSPSPSLSPSPKSTWLHKPTQKDDELVQVFHTATSSLTKLTDKYVGQEGETRDHAMANMVLTELQAAKEPKKSQLRAKLMSTLIEHMTSND